MLDVRIDEACFNWTNASGASFKNASIDQLTFWLATLSDADCRGVQLESGNFASSKLDNADFTDISFDGTVLQNADLRATMVRGAHFHDVFLGGATGTPVGAVTATFDNAECPDHSFQ